MEIRIDLLKLPILVQDYEIHEPETSHNNWHRNLQ
jgi:hypothetical protein